MSKGFIEAWYAKGLFPYIRDTLEMLFGGFSFSVFELLIVLFLVLIFVGLGFLLRSLTIARPFARPFAGPIISHPFRSKTFWMRAVRKIGVVLLVLVLSFLILWGLNYRRLSLPEQWGVRPKSPQAAELEQMTLDLIQLTTKLRSQYLQEYNLPDSQLTLSMGSNQLQSVLQKAWHGYAAIPDSFNIPDIGAFQVKPLKTSLVFSLLGISGIYGFPTGEANVNVHQPAISIPFTALHEIAHKLGYAREDEANYLGWIAGIRHPDSFFRYSASLKALRTTLWALYRTDYERWQVVKETIPMPLRAEINAISHYWQSWQNPLRSLSRRANDLYLKSNGLHDGVMSYNRMVLLLINEWRHGGFHDLGRSL